ncbi:MAG: phosphotransferase, partial [Pseudomonadota bacterium]|nr:phosphotransferase [Pseudomonadota bacterium]
GFFLLSDLGNTHLADLLGDEDRTLHYKHLIKLSAQWAQIPPAQYMKVFDGEFLQFELSIFRDWLVDNFIGEQLSADEQQMWQQACELLINNALEQPIVTVHRDFHSRNIMRTGQQWAIIDYQDAVQGPVCYDLVSLLRDCYFKLPEQELDYLLHYAYDEFSEQQLLQDTSFAMFKRWFDLTGVQRHLKAAGIFCRLKLRDGKSGYLNNVLPTLKYISNVSKEYPELTALGQWIEQIIIPQTKQRLTKESK